MIDSIPKRQCYKKNTKATKESKNNIKSNVKVITSQLNVGFCENLKEFRASRNG